MSKNIYQLLHIYIMSASSQFRPKLTQTQTKNSHKLNTRHSMHCLLNLIKLSNPGKGTYLRPIKWVSYNFNSILKWINCSSIHPSLLIRLHQNVGKIHNFYGQNWERITFFNLDLKEPLLHSHQKDWISEGRIGRG